MKGRDEIRFPDLVEISSVYWDLKVWSQVDFKEYGRIPPFTDEMEEVYEDLSEERIEMYSRGLERLILQVAEGFKGDEESGDEGPVLLWRVPHHTPRNIWVSYNL